jgi:hypothetical protein
VHAVLNPGPTASDPRGARSPFTATALKVTLAAFLLPLGCHEKITGRECEALVDRYAELVVLRKMPGAPREVVEKAQKLVIEEAKGDEGFRNCTTQIGKSEYACAMAAMTPEAIESCLE